MEVRSAIALPLPTHRSAFGVLTRGSLDGFPSQGLVAVRFAKGATELRLSTSAEAARNLILAGAPLNEGLAYGGPFVMSTAAQLLDAKRRFAAGDMGQLAASY